MWRPRFSTLWHSIPKRSCKFSPHNFLHFFYLDYCLYYAIVLRPWGVCLRQELVTMAPPKSLAIFTIVLHNFTFSLAPCGSEERRMIACHLNSFALGWIVCQNNNKLEHYKKILKNHAMFKSNFFLQVCRFLKKMFFLGTVMGA